MLVDLRLQNFRSYHDDAFEFNEGVTIVVGPNASGKTNLLEAILVVLTGSSYRTAADFELIEFDQPWARLDATLEGQERTVKLERVEGSSLLKKTYLVDQKPYKRLPKQQAYPVVVFEPEHLLLLTAQPQLRRAYMDTVLTQSRPGYNSYANHYRRVLQQRNALLKQGGANAARQLFVWNIRLSELGAALAVARMEMVEALNALASATYSELAGQTSIVRCDYISPFSKDAYGSQMMRALEQSVDKDLMRGFTSVGPHREDLTIHLNGKLASETASRGETRTLLLMLKVLELKIAHEAHQKPPILLLDDVFSELDGARRRTLATALRQYQTFITTTDADVVVQHFSNDCSLVATGKAE